jgi:ATP-dependent protease ClpP protease subunit
MNRAEKRRKGRGERSYDIYSRLLRERVIMLYGSVGDSSCLFDARQDPHAYTYDLPDSGRRFCEYCVAAAVSGSRGSIQTHSLVHQLSRCEFQHMWFPFTPNDPVNCLQAAA